MSFYAYKLFLYKKYRFPLFVLCLAVNTPFVFTGCNDPGSTDTSMNSGPGSGSNGVSGPSGTTGATGPNGASCHYNSHILAQENGPYLQLPKTAVNMMRGREFQKLRGHIPRAVKRFSDHGKLDENQELSVTVALNLNNEADLDRYLYEVYSPGSNHYHHFLSPQEFRSRYAPREEQINQVEAYLRSGGIQPVSVNENHLFIRARGSVLAMNSMFHTELHRYLDRQGRSYFSPAYEFQIPAGIPIRAVHGLQNVTHWRNYSRIFKGKKTAHSGSGPNSGLSPDDIRTAYRIPKTLDGSGQTLGLFELDGYSEDDITNYESQFGLPSVSLTNILVGQATGDPGNGAPEVTLDIELMIAIAPGAKQILVYEGPNDEQGVLDTYSKIANDNQAQEVSTSWGSSETQGDTAFLESENTVFKQMAAQGQTIYAAAGDNGADDNGSSLSVDDPGSQPYMVAVGGTLLYTAEDGSYDHETTWNESSGGAGGGGVSTVWSQPSWQSGVITSQSLGSTSMRNMPDVALEADPTGGYAIYSGGQWTIYGGTSCAAPLWAAFTALVNQQRASNGLSPLGFPNPVLYQLGQGKRYSSDFFDIADGSTNGYYPAIPKYDDATGWGSFDGEYLAQDLAQDQASAPVQGSDSTSREKNTPANSCVLSEVRI